MLKCECLYYTSYNEKVGHADYNNVAHSGTWSIELLRFLI